MTKSGRVPALLAAVATLAAHFHREPFELAVETVRGRGKQVVEPGGVSELI